jgi:hypothetical protein
MGQLPSTGFLVVSICLKSPTLCLTILDNTGLCSEVGAGVWRCCDCCFDFRLTSKCAMRV